jgi:transcriptional regulator
MTWVHDRTWLRALVEQLTDQYEAPRSVPWRVSDAPDDYVAKMLDAIVGIEIPINELTAKMKLSQNRSAADREGVRTGLAQGPSAKSMATAGLMSARGDGGAR